MTAVPDPVDPQDATPQVGQALQIWVANHHWEAALSIQTLRDKLRQAREALTTARQDAAVGTVIVKGTEEWHEINLKRMLDDESKRARQDALNEVERIVKSEAGPGDVYMRADVLSVIQQVRASAIGNQP